MQKGRKVGEDRNATSIVVVCVFKNSHKPHTDIKDRD